ncbi:helix-turn-helix domain-containing protein [Streptosporangium jomthongense]|uniref:Helix-turn-helix domain-containing protein n=1 Tax=Streptosporangium jomthongense TaxID=1193683 RepID=A0ABV8FC15_9ACTN
MNDTTLLSIPEVAKRLGVHRTTVYDYISDGDLVAVDIARTGAKRIRLRVPEEALRAYIASRPRVIPEALSA